MRFLYHLFVYGCFYAPITFLFAWLGQVLDLYLNAYGLLIISMVCGLNRMEAICCAIIFGIGLDAMQSKFCLHAFLLSTAIVLCYREDWKNILKSRSVFCCIFLNISMYFTYLGCMFFLQKIPVSLLCGYFPSIVTSCLLVGLMIPKMLKIQERYLL